jgi:DNA-binding PadR family transcriptional regulator
MVNLELTVLLAIARLGDNAYGLAIRSDVSERTNRDYSVGAIYTTLTRLEKKGLVSTHMSDPLPTRGGRSRREFKLTSAGRAAIRAAEQVALSVWSGVGISINPGAA